MTEVLTYATEEQANNDLERTFDRNNEVIGELEKRFGELSEISKSKADGEEFEVDCVLSLEKMKGRYSFQGGVRANCEFFQLGGLKTIEELASLLKRDIKSRKIFNTYNSIGVNINPVFYTVEKPQQDIEFKNLKIEGLTSEEIAEFVRLYDGD